MPQFEYNFNEAILEPGEGEIVRTVYTRPLNEGRLRDFCDKHGIVNYLPLRKVIRLKRVTSKGKSYQYQNIVLRPMFPNYIFVKMTPDQRALLYKSGSSVRILGDQETPSNKLLDEIRLVRRVETIAMDEELEFNKGIKEGGKFLIESGPWAGVYGWLKKKRNHSLWTVEIECVNSIVQATIDPSHYQMTPVDN